MDTPMVKTNGADVKIVFIMTQAETTNRVAVVLVGVILKARLTTMDKLTDGEIVKALEDALYRIKGAEHLIVPKEGVDNLCNGLENVLDLINRLQAKNEELVGNNDKLKSELFDKTEQLNVELQAMRGAANSYKAENEKLKKEKDEYAYLYDKHINTSFSHIKSEAYKEVFEKLKDKSIVCKVKLYGKGKFFPCLSAVTLHDINRLKKELVGEDK